MSGEPVGALVETRCADGVMTITLADPERRNALCPELMAELLAACDAADADPSVRVVVLTNVGKVFCAGANLATASGAVRDAARTAESAVGEGDAPAADPTELFGRFRRSGKPYVGRIAGHCVAGGMGLAAAMDISVAADDVLFGFTEVRVGVAPAVVSVVCLPRMRDVDARAAMLRGQRFLAPEAARMGLITSAVPRSTLDAEVDAVVDDLLAAGPGALAATKQLLDRVPAMPQGEAFAWARALSTELFATEEAAEGMVAFMEKRPASWVPPSRRP
jgi:methylglutaconyl-CoA hydratase